MSAVVLCGGLGSRMAGLATPKHLAHVGGRPIAARIVGELAAIGCKDIVVVSRDTTEELFIRAVGRSAKVVPQRGHGTGAAVVTAWHVIRRANPNPSLIWIVPGDMPLLTASFLTRAATELEWSQLDVLIVTKDKPPGLRHVDYVVSSHGKFSGFITGAATAGPVSSGLMLFKRNALAAAAEGIDSGCQGELRTVDLVLRCLARRAAVGLYRGTDETLLDVNTREALRRAEELAG